MLEAHCQICDFKAQTKLVLTLSGIQEPLVVFLRTTKKFQSRYALNIERKMSPGNYNVYMFIMFILYYNEIIIAALCNPTVLLKDPSFST